MNIPVEQSKIPTPSASSGQALSQMTQQGWGTRTQNAIPFDPEYSIGARNAVSVCLRVQPEEKVCVITDEAYAGDCGGHRSGTGEARVAAPGVGAGGSGGAAAKGFAGGDSCRSGDQPGFDLCGVGTEE